MKTKDFARQLRIGNLMLDDGGLPVELDSIEKSWDEHNNTYYMFYDSRMSENLSPEPIPITSDWLLKFGFERIDHIGGYSFWSTKRKKNSRHSGITIYSSYTTVGNNSMVKHCEYVHQLQNLYFALTGEELELKEEVK